MKYFVFLLFLANTSFTQIKIVDATELDSLPIRKVGYDITFGEINDDFPDSINVTGKIINSMEWIPHLFLGKESTSGITATLLTNSKDTINIILYGNLDETKIVNQKTVSGVLFKRNKNDQFSKYSNSINYIKPNKWPYYANYIKNIKFH